MTTDKHFVWQLFQRGQKTICILLSDFAEYDHISRFRMMEFFPKVYGHPMPDEQLVGEIGRHVNECIND